jgi:hypothetical protein
MHAFSAADAFAEPSENGQERNERQRSLCDGGGALNLCETAGKNAVRSQNVQNVGATNPQILQTHRRLRVWAAAANEPMRGKRRGRTTARYDAVNNATMAA